MSDHRSVEYAVHPAVAYSKRVIDGMKTKTGRSIDEWVTFVLSNGPQAESDRQTWLKEQHGLGTNYAGWVASRCAGREEDAGDAEVYRRKAPEYVAKMYAGKREGLLPLHDALIALSLRLGPNIKICPCVTFVPIFCNHVIAQIKPATNSRIDLGLALKDTPASGCLVDTGGFAKKDRITHRIPVTAAEEIDDEVAHWMRVAYDMDAQ